MREAIGSSWLLGIAAIFIALFCTFLAVSINYTKSYNVKNVLITAIEKREGFKLNNNGNNVFTENGINSEIAGYGYTEITTDSRGNYNQYYNECKRLLGDGAVLGANQSSGGYAYCVKRICSNNGSYYKVIAFASIEIPLINFDIKVPISGETKTIYCDINDANCKRVGNSCSIN